MYLKKMNQPQPEKKKKCHPDDHEYEYLDDDYTHGEAREIYICIKCGAKSYSALPD